MPITRDELAGLLFDDMTYADGQHNGPFYRPVDVELPGKPAGIHFRQIGKSELEPALEALPAFYAFHPTAEWVETNVDILIWWQRKRTIASALLYNHTLDGLLRLYPVKGAAEIEMRCNDAEARLRHSIKGLTARGMMVLSNDGKWLYPSAQLIEYMSTPTNPVLDTLQTPSFT